MGWWIISARTLRVFSLIVSPIWEQPYGCWNAITSLYIASHKFLSSRFQSLCNGVHTAYGRNDPDFIADSCLPVGSAVVAFKICVLCGFYVLMAFRLIIISKNISKSPSHYGT